MIDLKSPPKNQFDITKHEWSDSAFSTSVGNSVQGDALLVYGVEYEISGISINKDDAIAIANHFKLLPDETIVINYEDNPVWGMLSDKQTESVA